MGSDRLTEEAALWRTRVDAGIADHEALEEWLRESPQRRSHLAGVDAVWSFFDEVRNHPEMERMRRNSAARTRGLRRPRMVIGAGLAACLTGIGLFIAVSLTSAPRSRLYETTDHNREFVQLSDGSQVTLDVGSKLLVSYSRARRELILYSGQALFDVAHDSERPFTVSALGRTVVATGTAFNVAVDGATLSVALLRGHVKVSTAGHSRGVQGTRELQLAPGQELSAAPGGDVVAPCDANGTLAWESGRIVFSDVSLDQAVSRENRYATEPISVSDSRLGRLRLSGVFNAGDTRAFAEAVATMLPVSAHFGTGGAILLAPRHPVGVGHPNS